MLVTKSQIKEAVKATNLGIDNISGDFAEKLDQKAKQLVKEACQRAKDNGRKTVMGKDL